MGRLLWFAIVAVCVLDVPAASRGDEADELLRRGMELYHSHHLAPGRFDQAIALYEKALALRPDDYRTLWELAMMHQIYGETLGDGDRERKIALWRRGAEYGKRAVDANPQGKEGHFYYMANMGACARIEGTLTQVWKFRTIKKEMDKVLELDPNYAPGLVARARYLTEMPGILGGSEEEAVGLYRKALEADPDYIIVYYYLAQIDVSHQRYDEAALKLQKIIDCKKPGNYANWKTIDRPWAEQLLNDIVEAKRSAR